MAEEQRLHAYLDRLGRLARSPDPTEPVSNMDPAEPVHSIKSRTTPRDDADRRPIKEARQGVSDSSRGASASLVAELSTPSADARQSAPDTPRTNPISIAILVALPNPELIAVKSAFKRTFRGEWLQKPLDGVVYDAAYGVALGEHEDLSIVLAAQNHMGMVPSAILATKTLRLWRPQVIAMAGICAGMRGRVELGDIVVGSQLYDYGSGKLLNGRLVPDYEPVPMEEDMRAYALQLAGDRNALTGIRDSWPVASGCPPTVLNAHVGAMASGAAVVADENFVESIVEKKRSLHAVDMESFGFAKAVISSGRGARSIVVKGVQDFADDTKNDNFRDYAAFVSAQFLFLFLSKYWDQINPPSQ